MTTFTLFPDTLLPLLPGAADPNPIILATRFFVSQAGWITHLRFWKHYQNTPFGNTWTTRAMRLHRRVDQFGGSVVVAHVESTDDLETIEGWQNIALGTPAYVVPGELYTVSSLMPAQVYSATSHFFDTDYVPGNPLWAPRSDSVAGNGSYQYIDPGDNTAYNPGNSFNATNYFVDVVFSDVDPSGVSPTVAFKSRESGVWVSRTAVPKVWTGSTWVEVAPKRWDSSSSTWINLP